MRARSAPLESESDGEGGEGGATCAGEGGEGGERGAAGGEGEAPREAGGDGDSGASRLCDDRAACRHVNTLLYSFLWGLLTYNKNSQVVAVRINPSRFLFIYIMSEIK